MKPAKVDPVVQKGLESISASMDEDLLRGKKVLVSGGAGFLGSWLCDIMVRAKARTTCVDNLSTGQLHNIYHLVGDKSFRFAKKDVCDHNEREKHDLVFHLASRPSPEDYQKHPVETALANSLGTQRMLEVARRWDTTLFYSSSSEVYGDPDNFPTVESYEGRVDPLGPRSCYEEGKRFGEALCKAYSDEYGLDVRIGRIFNSYGPRLRAEGSYGRVVSRFILQALTGKDLTVFGDGTQTRSFCYVVDTVRGILKMATAEGLNGTVLNVGTDEEIKIADLAARIIELSKSKSRIVNTPFPAGDHYRRSADTSKIFQKLEWKPEVSLDDGLRATIGWFRRIPR